jgi:hypothetical protein
MKQDDVKNESADGPGKEEDVLIVSPATSKISKYIPLPPLKKPVDSVKYILEDRESGR